MAEPRQYPTLLEDFEAAGVCIPPQVPLPQWQRLLIRGLLRDMCRYLRFHS